MSSHIYTMALGLEGGHCRRSLSGKIDMQYVTFAFQTPDKKRVLTIQRTFDSEGEKYSFIYFSLPPGEK